MSDFSTRQTKFHGTEVFPPSESLVTPFSKQQICGVARCDEKGGGGEGGAAQRWDMGCMEKDGYTACWFDHEICLIPLRRLGNKSFALLSLPLDFCHVDICHDFLSRLIGVGFWGPLVLSSCTDTESAITKISFCSSVILTQNRDLSPSPPLQIPAPQDRVHLTLLAFTPRIKARTDLRVPTASYYQVSTSLLCCLSIIPPRS